MTAWPIPAPCHACDALRDSRKKEQIDPTGIILARAARCAPARPLPSKRQPSSLTFSVLQLIPRDGAEQPAFVHGLIDLGSSHMPAAPQQLPQRSGLVVGEKRYVSTWPHFPGKLSVLIASAIVVAGLYFGREILVPIALALLLSFVLAPGVRWLGRWHLGRIASVLVMVAFAFTVILGIGAVVATQVGILAGNLPRYESTVTGKIHSLQAGLSQISILERASHMLRNISDEIARPSPQEQP